MATRVGTMIIPSPNVQRRRLMRSARLLQRMTVGSGSAQVLVQSVSTVPSVASGLSMSAVGAIRATTPSGVLATRQSNSRKTVPVTSTSGGIVLRSAGKTQTANPIAQTSGTLSRQLQTTFSVLQVTAKANLTMVSAFARQLMFSAIATLKIAQRPLKQLSSQFSLSNGAFAKATSAVKSAVCTGQAGNMVGRVLQKLLNSLPLTSPSSLTAGRGYLRQMVAPALSLAKAGKQPNRQIRASQVGSAGVFGRNVFRTLRTNVGVVASARSMPGQLLRAVSSAVGCAAKAIAPNISATVSSIATAIAVFAAKLASVLRRLVFADRKLDRRLTFAACFERRLRCGKGYLARIISFHAACLDVRRTSDTVTIEPRRIYMGTLG